MTETNLTAKQEQFAQLIANGSAYNAAYSEAYNAEGMSQTTIDVEASKLAKNPKVAPRIAEIQADIRDALNINTESQTIRLRLLSGKAEIDGNLNAAINAEKEINKLHGLITDKHETNTMPPIIISGPEANL